MTQPTLRRSLRRLSFSAPVLLALTAGVVLPAWAQDPPPSRCSDDGTLPPSSTAVRDAALLETGSADPRAQLQELVQKALDRSKSIGASRMLAQAAEADLAEAKSQRFPTVNLGLTGSHVGSQIPGGRSGGAQFRAAGTRHAERDGAAV